MNANVRPWLWIGGAVVVLFFFSRRADAAGGTMPRADIDVDGSDVDATTAIQRFAEAIANAEGYGRAGAIPTRANNPGDLIIPGWTGEKLGAEGISVFATPSEGWRRLRNQLILIRDGKSRVYSPSLTIAQMGAKWAPAEGAIWATNVARGLNVSTSTVLSEVLS
jgi:hypothetical protein